MAFAALVVIRVHDMKVVYSDSTMDQLQIPYIPGYLGAREFPPLARLLEIMRNKCSTCFPQVLLIDGNGILHPRGCGLACYVGVKEKIPCIGVAKTLYRMPSWSDGFEREIRNNLRKYADEMDLMENGEVVGKALIASPTSQKPLYVSVGHDIDLDTAIWVVKLCTKYRIPEPVRQADMLSRKLVADYKPVKSADKDGFVS